MLINESSSHRNVVLFRFSRPPKQNINYSASVLLFFFLTLSWLYLPSFVFIAHNFSTLLDYKSWTAFYAFIGLHFSSPFISFSFHPISRLASCWYWLPQLTWQCADVSVWTNSGYSFPQPINQYTAFQSSSSCLETSLLKRALIHPKDDGGCSFYIFWCCQYVGFVGFGNKRSSLTSWKRSEAPLSPCHIS